jgi:lipopolysaccharide export LptBFGC system permease protein LptF
MKQFFSKWKSIIALAVFGLLVGTDFSVVSSSMLAVIIGIVIAAVFVVISKLTGLDMGWPKS